MEIGNRTYVCPSTDVALYSIRLDEFRRPAVLSEADAFPLSQDSAARYVIRPPVLTSISHVSFEKFQMVTATTHPFPHELQEIPDTKPGPNLKPDSLTQP